ncbi:MAG: tetratricopeptide repeat protein [Thermodesulfobacteriota bacterium]
MKVFRFLFIAALVACFSGGLHAQEQKPARQDIYAKEGQQVLSLINTKKYDEAIKLSEQILAGLAERKLDRTYEASTAYNNLGVIYYFKSDYKKADETLKKALDLRIALLGPDDPQVAVVWKNLSDMHVAQARSYYEQYQRIQKVNAEKKAAGKK